MIWVSETMILIYLQENWKKDEIRKCYVQVNNINNLMK